MEEDLHQDHNLEEHPQGELWLEEDLKQEQNLQEHPQGQFRVEEDLYQVTKGVEEHEQEAWLHKS